MQPNNPYEQLPPQPQQQPQPLSTEYLNAIAPAAQVKTLNPFVLWGIIGGALVLLVMIVIGISSSTGTSTDSLAAVATKLDRLQTVTKDAQDTVQSSELRTLNSTLNLSLTNTNRDLAEPLKLQKINLKDKKNQTVTTVTDEFTELDSRLEDARLNGVFDRTYAREMTFTLKTLRSDMAALYKKSGSKSVKDTLLTTDQNFKPLVEGFSEFNAS